MAYVSTRWAGDVAVVTPRGYLMGGDETDELSQTIDSLLTQGNRKLVIDLIDTAHMNSTALGVMNRARQLYQEKGGQVRLCHLTHRIDNALVITRLSLIFDVHATEREAIEAFHAQAAP
jgi:anti-anti-sigma factor